jgi:hypothetical protein
MILIDKLLYYAIIITLREGLEAGNLCKMNHPRDAVARARRPMPSRR